MAQRNFHMPPIAAEIENTIEYDGEDISTFRADQVLERAPDDSLKTKKRNRTKIGADSMGWNPAMAKDMPIALCDDCRHPPWRFPRRPIPRTGLLAMQNAVRCQCGRLLCPHCRVEGSDGRHRCRRCNRLHRLRTLITWIFWTKV